MAILIQNVLALLTLVCAFTTVKTNAFQVTGVRNQVQPNGQRPFRQNIATFSTCGPAFDMYILALQNMSAADQNELLSFFQVTGIHGYPVLPWDGVNGNGTASGYCTHDFTLFPVWHRPFLALYEQMLYDNVQVIASEYPPDQIIAYKAAANEWRIPYWDWSTSPELPAVATLPNITINTPNGRETMDNPLFQYNFHPHLTPADSAPANDHLTNLCTSVRYPDSSGYSNNALANQNLKANSAGLHVLTYQLLASQSNYTVMSTGALSDRELGYNSLESLHNMIHLLVGGYGAGPGGHMSFTQWSAFDPIFWMHHANVHRIFAMWQAIWPDSFVEPMASVDGTFTEPKGFIETANTHKQASRSSLTGHPLCVSLALTPFHKDGAGNFWTPNEVRSTRAFGYAYPEVIDWNTNATALSNSVRANVNALLNPTGGLPQGSPNVGQPGLQGRDVNTTQGPVDAALSRAMGVNNLNRQWSIGVQANKNAITSSYMIHFFLGDPPSDPMKWAHAANLVGTHAVLSKLQPGETSPVKRRSPDMPSMPNSGSVPLTHILAAAIRRGSLTDLNPSNVIPFLSAKLQWRVFSVAHGPVNTEDVDDLQVIVISRAVTPATSETEFPNFGELEAHHNVTAGKPGGSKKGFKLVKFDA